MNPKGSEKVAGGRSEAKTTGKEERENRGTPERCQTSIPRMQSFRHSYETAPRAVSLLIKRKLY